MAFLVKADLHTHLYPEIIDEIIRKMVLPFDSEEDFPEVGVSGYIYQDESGENAYFSWSGTSYISATDPDVIVETKINAAISEVKSYLSKYDLEALFADDAEFDQENLKEIVKYVACWKLVSLANPNVNIELFRTNYKDAIDWLKLVQQGKAEPQGWPFPQDDPATPGNENTSVQWSSNKKRRQHL